MFRFQRTSATASFSTFVFYGRDSMHRAGERKDTRRSGSEQQRYTHLYMRWTADSSG
ncbi:hypothetical protein CGRA01v4_11897 [Colletotrichum graminicola]|nr:hypothetical protein CGRA01v4_11897 [Colletotrichum graminicola]